MAVNGAMREQCLRVRTPNVENTFRPWQGCCPDEACSGKEMSRAAQHRAFRSSQQTMVFLVGLAAQEEAQQRCGSSLEENREPFTTSSCKPQIDVRSSCGNGDSWHFLWLEREGPAVRKLPAPLGLHSWVPWAVAGMPADHSCLHSPPPSTPPIGRRSPLFLVPQVGPAFLPFLPPLPSGLRHLTAPQPFY